MAHQLTVTNGVAEMAYAGDTPWHGLGQQVERGAAIEVWAQQAGMEWRIQRSKVRYAFEREQASDAFATMDDQHVLFRSDNKSPLGIVSSKFKVVQPIEVLEFFRDLTEGAGFHIETAGTLFEGRRFWALAHIGDECEIVPGDRVGGYLLLCTGADGTLATTGKFTTVRVVCNNTLSMSLSESGKHTISHKREFNPVEMKQKLGIAHEEFSAFSGHMKRISDKHVSAQRAERLTFELLKPADFDTQDAEKKHETIERVSDSKGFRSIIALFEGGGKGSEMDGVKDTAWGWLNAVTEYTDYYVRAQSQDNRFNSAMLGTGSALKDKAVALVDEL